MDHAIHFGPEEYGSDLLRALITLGDSVPGGFGTLQTLRSPSDVCEASISDFCFDDDACQAKLTIGDGPLAVVSVCKMVNVGCNVAIKIDPFWYLNDRQPT